MDNSDLASMTLAAASPDFGEGVTRRAHPCSARELFTRLFRDLEASVHYFEPAFHFATSALRAALPPALDDEDAPQCLTRLRCWAASSVEADSNGARLEGWPARVALEFAPAGLTDGAWLRGSVFANAVESEVGMLLLRQLMLRMGFPGLGEGYGQRYSALLKSIGLESDPIGSPVLCPEQLCSDAAYEHALLGLCLGLFPSAFGPETLGFNVWMTDVGPCPLMERALRGALAERGACLRYFELHERSRLGMLAEAAICAGAERARAAGTRRDFLARVARGFAAADTSYRRWHESVLATRRAPAAPQLDGQYAAPHEPESLAQFALRRYGKLASGEQYYCMANVDVHPAVAIYGRAFVDRAMARLAHAFATDPRLNSMDPPPYSERAVAALVAAQHDKNVRSRRPPTGSDAGADVAAAPGHSKQIGQIFDGFWLQGYADVSRAEFEEYGWLFRIYASEHGEGELAWNHSHIFRLALAELGPDIMLPKTDARLYRLFQVRAGSVAMLAASLNTRHFMPELLGTNLGIEATGVGGSYMDDWRKAEGRGAHWKALIARLHNSIDNYADGHTKWSIEAVQSFMRRVKDAAPDAVEAQWQRVWRLWRCQDILTCGTKEEQSALLEYFDIQSLASV